jgi:AcrR family transcriptional regulator
MSLASYQLLHSAMFFLSGCKGTTIFWIMQIFCGKIVKNRYFYTFASVLFGYFRTIFYFCTLYLHCAIQEKLGRNKTMSISKTRQKLVDVARQLFAKNGLENTTMNDIAQFSGKGRRTLYTYFKSKDDIYYAVIESELERLSDQLDEVAAKRIPPQEKIIELIYMHLSMIRETVVRNGNLRAEFFRNIWMVEKVRKNFDDAEIELFRKVFREGKEDGEFDIENVDLVADITHYCIKGLEVPYIYGRIAHGMTEEATKPQVAKIVYSALGKRIKN